MIIATAIKEARAIPSGVLYAAVCAKISLTEYDGAIRLLKQQNLISEKQHLLTWEVDHDHHHSPRSQRHGPNHRSHSHVTRYPNIPPPCALHWVCGGSFFLTRPHALISASTSCPFQPPHGAIPLRGPVVEASHKLEREIR